MLQPLVVVKVIGIELSVSPSAIITLSASNPICICGWLMPGFLLEAGQGHGRAYRHSIRGNMINMGAAHIA